MRQWMIRATLLLILFVALSLRLTGIDWDDYRHFHPDERYITWVATTIEWPERWETAFDPVASSWNPYYWPADASSEGIEVLQGERRNFAYGHLPLYLGVAATRLAERIGPLLAPHLPANWLLTRDLLNGADTVEFNHLTAVTRALTGLVDAATVLLLFLLGRQIYGTAVGLLAAAFLALNVMHIQLAHFFTFDPYLTFFVVAALYGLVLAAGAATARRRTLYTGLGAVMIGLAVGSKFAAILLVLPLILLFALDRERPWSARLSQFALFLFLAFLAFAVTNPFALLDYGCRALTPAVRLGSLEIPALNWRSCFLANIGTQGGMVRGQSDFPFTRQYSGTVPYLYFIEMQLRWGMGPLLGLVAFGGFTWAAIRGARTAYDWFEGDSDTPPEAALRDRTAELLLLAWALPFFLSTGNFYVKFMRYLQPVTPVLMLFGAAMLVHWFPARLRRPAAALTVGLTALYALSFVNLYNAPHPWVAASNWIYRHVPPEATILNEAWDDPLPTNLPVDGVRRTRGQYREQTLNWLSGTGESDSQAKLRENLDRLTEGDFLILASNRNYGVVPRLAERYPLSSRFHSLLFDGSLGYELVYVNSRSPNLAGFHLQPDMFTWAGLEPPDKVTTYLENQHGVNWGRADESFTVYDQPLVMIFKNTGQLSTEEMQVQIERLFRTQSDEGHS